MDIRIRSCETNEVLHTISVDPDDERRDELVKQAIGRFELEDVDVYVEDADTTDAAADDGEKEPDTAPESLTGDAAPRDDEASSALSASLDDGGGAADRL